MMSDENMEASEGCTESRITVSAVFNGKTGNQRRFPTALFPFVSALLSRGSRDDYQEHAVMLACGGRFDGNSRDHRRGQAG